MEKYKTEQIKAGKQRGETAVFSKTSALGKGKFITMGKIKEIFKKMNIVEGLMVSFFGGWALFGITNALSKQIDNQMFSAEFGIGLFLIEFIVCFGILFFLYMVKDSIARILMFLFIFVFFLQCAYTGYSVDWGNRGYEISSYNNIGMVFLDVILGAFVVIAFLYVKEDIYNLFKIFRLSRKKMYIMIGCLGLIMILFAMFMSYFQYKIFSCSTFDFGIYAQMYEYMRQTGVECTTLERNILVNHLNIHFSPVYYLGLPLYMLVPSPITVQLIEAIMIALPLLPILLLCRRYKLSNWMTAAVALLYAFYPVTLGEHIFYVHENCFLIFFLLMLIWAIENDKYITTVIFVILTFSVKEEACFYILVLGLYFLVSKRKKVPGLLMMAASLIYFVVLSKVLFGYGLFNTRFSNLFYDFDNNSLTQMLYMILSNPAYTISQITNNGSEAIADKLEYMMLMILPVFCVLFSVKKNYSRYILFLPFVLFNILPSYLWMHNIYYQYNFGTLAFFVYVIIMNMGEMESKKRKTAISVSLICSMIMFCGAVLPLTISYYSMYQKYEDIYDKTEELLDMIPEDASVIASGVFTPHLSKNLELYDYFIKEEETGEYMFGVSDYTDLPITDYIVVRAEDYENETVVNLLNRENYNLLVELENMFRIYQREDISIPQYQ